MGRKLLDISGQVFERLTALWHVDRRNHSSVWRCRCSCGAVVEVARTALLNGTSKSCGCFRRERMETLTFKHGERGADLRAKSQPEYKAWDSMKQRCTNPNDRSWPRYGGRGITVCEEWSHDFQAFLAHIGRRPSDKHSIDRIDGDKGYEPGNVRWATWEEQARNRANTCRVMFRGKLRSLAEVAELSGVPYPLFKGRVRKGWSVERAATEGVHASKSHPRHDT